MLTAPQSHRNTTDTLQMDRPVYYRGEEHLISADASIEIAYIVEQELNKVVKALGKTVSHACTAPIPPRHD
jgi:macrodomain Ter protein organizer (MatP/YcbG family)